MTTDLLTLAFPPYTRVLGRLPVGYRKGTVDSVGILRDRGVVYVDWDKRNTDEPARKEAVVASALLVLDAG